MTQAEWLACTDPRLLLRYDRYNHRKSGLLACACCRRIWPLLIDVFSQKAVELAEEYLDGSGDVQTIRYAERAADQTRRQAARQEQESRPSGAMVDGFNRGQARLVMKANRAWPTREAARAASQSISAVSYAVRGMSGTEFSFLLAMEAMVEVSDDPEQEQAWQCQVLRDIFGNPSHPVTIDPAWCLWNDGTVVKLAQAIYDERELPSGQLDAGRLAILADALEDAGCANADVLSHCRTPGPHVRGCWVVDLLLGRE